MYELSEYILTFLAEDHGRHDLPGWTFVLGMVFSVGSMIATHDQLKKRQALKAELSNNLAARTLTVQITSNKASGRVEYQGRLIIEQKAFRLYVHRRTDGQWQVTIDETFDSLAEVDSFLRARTPFILADFRDEKS